MPILDRFSLIVLILVSAAAFPDQVAIPDPALAAKTSRLPHCVSDASELEKIKSVLAANRSSANKYNGYRAALQSDSDTELFARLVYSETLAANCPALDEKMASKIAAAVANRVRLRNGNVRDVVFQRDQFASSLNVYAESRYRDFLCPKNPDLWRESLKSARAELARPGHGDTVNYFLYKHSPKWKKEPWKLAEDDALSTPDVAACIRFFHNPNWK